MYAADTTVNVTGKNVEEVIDDVNIVADKSFDCCHKNKLTVHKGKIEAIIMSANEFIGPLRPIQYGGHIINYVKETMPRDKGAVICNAGYRDGG